MDITHGFPRQQLPFSRKTKAWGRSCVDWAGARTYYNHAPVRRGVVHMKVNYDLVNGKVHMRDVASLLNPSDSSSAFSPDRIQHYPIINKYLNELEGEAGARVFDWRAIVTNPDSISDIEEGRRRQFMESFRAVVEDGRADDLEAQRQAELMDDHYGHEWQDIREIRANEVLRHYSKEQGFKDIFLEGFKDATIVGEEIYQCDIVGGEPVLAKLNPRKLRVYKSGYSNRIEDADIIVYEDYWSPGRVIDTWYDRLKAKDVEWLESMAWAAGAGSEPLGAAGNVDDTHGFVRAEAFEGPDGVDVPSDDVLGLVVDELANFEGGMGSDLNPYDMAGNVRVLRVFWKSRRKILKVKHYDPETGDELFDFYPETYVPDEAAGEEAETFWVNEAWEGTKIGSDIYVGIGPRPVQYNTMDNPSRCHFGIVGTIYNLNEGRPYSLVDMMKPYNYLYDVIADRMTELIAVNWGNLLEMDLALVPKGWEVEKWMYFARVNKVLVKDSFREGDKGAATGKLAGGLNNASKGVVSADWGDSIQYYYGLMEQLDASMGRIIGMSQQRLGAIGTRETVGGVERSTLQSSYITDWLFQKHDDTMRRALTCFLETAKAAFRGRTKKFPYFLSDKTMRVMEVDGDQFAESDYGIVVDNSSDTQKFASRLDTLAQAAIQNGVMDFATIMKLYSSRSLSEKTRLVEDSERKMQERQLQARQEQLQAQRQAALMEQDAKLREMRNRDELNRRDNETKIKVAEINSRAEWLRLGAYADDGRDRERQAEQERRRLDEERRQFDADLGFRRDELRERMEVERKKIGLRQAGAEPRARAKADAAGTNDTKE